MSLALHHEYTRVPVTALASCGTLVLAAEGPFVRFYCSKSKSFGFLTTTRIFKAQSIHGIAILSGNSDHVIAVCWGGKLVRALEFTFSSSNGINALHLSPTVKTSDWIFDLAWGPIDVPGATTGKVGVCAAVTAHNALLEFTIERRNQDEATESPCLVMSFCELTSSTRSILYSAHILWDRLDHILVAAGTAFGEIIFWSWTRKPTAGPNARIHHVFLGHEGSIFGVQISKELELAPGKKRQRLLASCSDDRTIRIWDVTTVSYNEDTTPVPDEDLDTQRTRHTGFSNTAFDEEPSSAACIAIGWGHISRVWTVQFLDALQSCSSQSLLSTGEDATSRTWNLIPKDLPLESKTEAQIYNLFQTSTTAHHSGKNIWSVTVCGNSTESQQVICGSADSKITARPLDCTRQSTAGDMSHVLKEYTVEDVVSLAQCSPVSLESNVTAPAHKSSRVSEFFRSYSFTDRYSFLLTTNSGQIYVGSVSPDSTESGNTISSSTFIDRIEELSGYSVCVGELSLGIGYVAGSRGGIYIHQKNVSHLQKIHTVTGKVGSMFADGPNLLITLLGQKVAQLLRVDVTDAQGPSTSDPINVDLSDLETGTVVTSMEYVTTASGVDFIFLGFRKGDIAICRTERRLATGIRVLEHVHKKETVTSLKWIPSSSDSLFGHLISVGRDGCCAIHSIDLSTQGAVLDSTLVHYLALPFGSNIEGFYYHYDHLIVYGFSSTKFVLYDTTTEEEIMSVDAGGAHRSWAFQPNPSEQGGGTLVWTRASSMHTFTQQGPNHQVIRSGGHGREIKAVASCVLKTANGTSKQLIATGAEDTDIKIFENTADGAFVCRRTLRKHTTGIQQLQWSEDGEYLFSSGGCEEFYVWRVRLLPDALGVGVVCEDVFEPESEHSDLRIMSFAVQRKDDSKKGFVIALVFSDSTIRVYGYNSPTPDISLPKHSLLSTGTYTTSSLTQCTFLSSKTVLTTGTDGHAIFWPLPSISMAQSSSKLPYANLTRIHQSSSKVLTSLILPTSTTLLISGGDDGSLSFLLSALTEEQESIAYVENQHTPVHPPTILVRAHASAITACVAFLHQSRMFVVTSGNDQWVRVWEVVYNPAAGGGEEEKDSLEVRRVRKVKTNVADVSSMALLGSAGIGEAEGGEGSEGGGSTRVLICGVGMEVIRLEWEVSL